MDHQCIVLLSVVGFLSAQNNDVLGLWINRDDKDGRQKSVLEIYMKDGIIIGKIIELLPAAAAGL
ncbi:MAG: hypothetical protein U0T81_04790 [Saprospiraceae bacterium]